MVCTATNSSHKWSAAICIPNKKKNANKKLARVSNVSLGTLNTPTITRVHVYSLEGGINMFYGHVFFLQHHRAVVPLRHNTHFAKLQRSIQLCQKKFICTIPAKF